MFIIRDTVWHVGEHIEKQFKSETRQKYTAREECGHPEWETQLRQKLGRDADPERKHMGILSKKGHGKEVI